MQFYQPGFQPRDPAAYQWFIGVDTNRSGTVDELELQRALSAGGWVPFSRKTTHKLMNMFDADRSHSLGYGEFEQLVGYLRSWQAQFQAATHGTGRLAHAQMPALLAQLGYNFPPPLASSIFMACAYGAAGLSSFWGFIRRVVRSSSSTFILSHLLYLPSPPRVDFFNDAFRRR
jgi:Ca2+-binding EF-hand superfamily protein